MNLLSEDAYKLVYDLCLPDEPEKKDYDSLIKLITEHFKSVHLIFRSAFFLIFLSTKNFRSTLFFEKFLAIRPIGEVF